MGTRRPDIAVRAAVVGDAAVVANIYNHYIAETVITFEEDEVHDWEMARRIEEVQAATLRWLVAEWDGRIVGYAYATEFFIAWYSGNEYERFTFINRAMGPYAWAYWSMVTCNVISPQFFWIRKLRTNIPFMFIISIFVNIGMWFERFVIIATSLHRDFIPSSWGYFKPSWVDILTFFGTFGLFLTLFLLFIRFVPMIAISEVKGVVAAQNHDHHEELAKVGH